ncbi:adenosine kinase [Trifolium repens]|nr:adenosine kinase [Trifolium repens]
MIEILKYGFVLSVWIAEKKPSGGLPAKNGIQVCFQDSQTDNVEEIALKISQWPKASGACSQITVIVQSADPVCAAEDGKLDIEQVSFSFGVVKCIDRQHDSR